MKKTDEKICFIPRAEFRNWRHLWAFPSCSDSNNENIVIASFGYIFFWTSKTSKIQHFGSIPKLLKRLGADYSCVDPKFLNVLPSKSSLFDLLASSGFVLGPPMSILNSAVTCQAVPDMPKTGDVEAEPEELLGHMINGEMDLQNPWKLTPDA